MVMFWPLVGLDGAGPAIHTEGFEFDLVADDVEALNKRAVAAARHGADPSEAYDITAISAHAYPHCASLYAITACGGSFGEGYGPKLVARADGPRDAASLRGATIAVPGVNTTAALLLALMLGPGSFVAREMLFSEVPEAIARGEVEAGVLIHEAQLMLDRHDLVPIADLGVWWGEETGLPLPLGLNVIRRDLESHVRPGAGAQLEGVLRRSIEHARSHGSESAAFLKARATDRPEWSDPALVERYLSMYVSDLTVDMGSRGRRALEQLFLKAAEAGLCPPVADLLIVDGGEGRSADLP